MDLVGHLLGLCRGRATHVEPELGDRTVVGEQFGDLVEVVLKVFFSDGVGVGVGLGVMLLPVDDGEVEGELHVDLAAFVSELFHRVFPECCLLDDVVVGRLGVPHGKTVMVLRSYHDVLHACVLCGLADLRSIPFVCGHLLGFFEVFLARNAHPGLDLFWVADGLNLSLVASSEH